MPPPARPLHADELTSFHALRTDLYQAVFELLRMPPRDGTLAEVRRLLAGHAARRRDHLGLQELDEALAGAPLERAAREYASLFAGESPAVSMRCPNPGCRHRGEAFAAVEILQGEDRMSELRVLGLLARRTLDALDAGNLPEASILTDVQGRFLGHHAVPCLGQFVTSLRAGGDSLYSRVGVALGWLLEEDLRLLGYKEARAR